MRRLVVILLEDNDPAGLAVQMQQQFATQIVIDWDVEADNGNNFYCWMVIQQAV